MDTLGALALATEPPTDHLMQRPPVGRRFVLYLTIYLSWFFGGNLFPVLVNILDLRSDGTSFF
jgi:P-type Ca2+ transporter type 2C